MRNIGALTRTQEVKVVRRPRDWETSGGEGGIAKPTRRSFDLALGNESEEEGDRRRVRKEEEKDVER
eukprot:199981-Hanusia_phi.AAC.1